MKQEFVANRMGLVRESGGVALADVGADGVPRHSLLLCIDEDLEGPQGLYLEYNDQSNVCDGSHLSRVELASTRLSLRFSEESPLLGGTVRQLDSKPIRELTVNFGTAGAPLADALAELERILEGRCPFSVVP